MGAVTHPGSRVDASHTLLKGFEGWSLLQLAELSANAPEKGGSLLSNGTHGPSCLLVPEEKTERSRNGHPSFITGEAKLYNLDLGKDTS